LSNLLWNAVFSNSTDWAISVTTIIQAKKQRNKPHPSGQDFETSDKQYSIGELFALTKKMAIVFKYDKTLK